MKIKYLYKKYSPSQVMRPDWRILERLCQNLIGPDLPDSHQSVGSQFTPVLNRTKIEEAKNVNKILYKAKPKGHQYNRFDKLLPHQPISASCLYIWIQQWQIFRQQKNSKQLLKTWSWTWHVNVKFKMMYTW
jgi:hypothetical protein